MTSTAEVSSQTSAPQRRADVLGSFGWRRGKSIGDVLKMEFDEAVDFFASMPNIAHPLQPFQAPPPTRLGPQGGLFKGASQKDLLKKGATSAYVRYEPRRRPSIHRNGGDTDSRGVS